MNPNTGQSGLNANPNGIMAFNQPSSINRPMSGGVSVNPAPKMPATPPALTSEQMAAIIQAAKAKKEAGATEATDPEFAKYLAILRMYTAHRQQLQQQQQQQLGQQNVSVGDNNGPSASSASADSFTPDQLSALKYQIMAFQHLSKNRAVPEHLQKAVFEPDTLSTDVSDKLTGASGNLPLKIAEAAINEEGKNEVASIDKTDSSAPTFINPYAVLPKPITANAHAVRQQRLLIPAATPTGIDPFVLMRERERRIKARIAFRIKELESVPSNLSNDSTADRLLLSSTQDPLNSETSLKIRALIELKALRLLDKQRKLREDVLKTVGQSTTLSTAVDRTVYRRMKKPTIRDARQTEKIERTQRLEREKREKQKSHEYLNSILNHGKDMITFHRMVQSKAMKLGQAVLRYHSNAEKEEQKRIQRISQERLKALKEDNEEAYLKLIDQAKDTRITTILSQTNQYLSSLTNAVVAQKSHIAQGESLEVVPTDEFAVPEDDEQGLRDYYNTAHRVQETVTEQPSILVGGKLKDYQLKGLQWMISLYNNRLNGILADEMGLGKTIQTISLITYLIEKKKQVGPFLIIVPLSTIANWKLEFEKWAPSVTKVVYKGSPNERKRASAEVRQGQFNVLLTTYEYIIKDRPVLSKVKWVHMIIDEGHRMKNAQSKLSITLMQYYSSRYRIILTGTPLQNNLPELWALLNFILPKIFNSVKSFDEWFNSPFANSGATDRLELNEEESLLIIRRLHKVLRPFLLRRLKKDVESELPDKVETVVKCNMSALQLKLYEQLRSRRSFYSSTINEGKKMSAMKALNNVVMQFRKICNHPFVFDEVESEVNPSKITDANIYRTAGKFELLDRIFPKFFATNHRILMFFQMTTIMDIMEDYLRWRGYKYLRLDGSIKAEDRGELLKLYNAPDSEYFVFLLSTRAGGLGLNLQTADTVIIFDSDWNPHQDLQAQDRAHRIGQTKEVRIYRLITSKSIEEHILARAQYKLDLDGKVIQAGKFDNKTSDAEREELLRALFGLEGEKEEGDEDEDISMNDDELNEILARDENELAIFKKIDAERLAKDSSDLKAVGKTALASKSRLITESELPESYLVDINEMLTQEKLAKEAFIFGRGARQRKEVVYDDGLNEEQFLDAVEEGKLDQAIEKKRQSKLRRLEKKKTKMDAEDEDDETQASGDDDDDEGARSRQGSRPLEQTPGASQSKAKKGRKKPNKFGVDPNEEDSIEPLTRRAMTRIFEACYQVVENLEVDVEGTMRSRSALFATLPAKQFYPDYYRVIKNPIAMDWIWARIHSAYYKSLSDFQDDFNLMFANAMTYNIEGSEVYADALEMKRVFEDKVKELCPNGEIIPNEADEAQLEHDRLNQDVNGNDSQSDEDLDVKPLGKEKSKRKRIKGLDDEDEDDESSSKRKKQKDSHEEEPSSAITLPKIKLRAIQKETEDDAEISE